MRKENKEKRDEVTMEIRNLLMETILGYCFKSKGGVEIALILKATAQIMGVQLAVMTQNWIEEETADAVDCYLNYVANTVKKCRDNPVLKEESDKLISEILNAIGKDNGVGN